MDADALQLASQRLRSAQSLDILNGDIVRRLRDVEKNGPYDLILCGGLFDYLSERIIVRIVGRLHRALKAGGIFAFTNISSDNPYRTWIEHLANWPLIHRHEVEIQSWLSAVEIDPTLLRMERDATGLTLLCTIASADARNRLADQAA